MAHLRSLFEDTGRGQLFLIGAISITFAFVILTLLVNTGIYTENLASRGNNVGETTTAQFATESRSSLTSIQNEIEDNHNGSIRKYNSTIGTYEAVMERRYGRSGAITNITTHHTYADSRVNQSGGTFEHPDGSDNWVVDSNVRNKDQWHYTLTRSDLYDGGGSQSSNAFQVVLDDGSNSNRFYIQRNGGLLTNAIEVYMNGSEVCQVQTSSAELDVTNETLGGNSCAGLQDVHNGISEPYEIRYVNGHQATSSWEYNKTGWYKGPADFQTELLNTTVTVDYAGSEDVYSETFVVEGDAP